MPGSEISELSDDELVEAARANSDDRTQHQIQAEMWRRTTVEARRAGLAASERGRRGQTMALWAIQVALLAVGLTMMVVEPLVQIDGTPDAGWIVGIILCALAFLGNGLALLASSNEAATARVRLREFDAEQ